MTEPNYEELYRKFREDPESDKLGFSSAYMAGAKQVFKDYKVAELLEVLELASGLILFAEADGTIVNGYKTKELVQELKTAVLKNLIP